MPDSLVIDGLGNGLAPVWCQAITWTRDDLRHPEEAQKQVIQIQNKLHGKAVTIQVQATILMHSSKCSLLLMAMFIDPLSITCYYATISSQGCLGPTCTYINNFSYHQCWYNQFKNIAVWHEIHVASCAKKSHMSQWHMLLSCTRGNIFVASGAKQSYMS